MSLKSLKSLKSLLSFKSLVSLKSLKLSFQNNKGADVQRLRYCPFLMFSRIFVIFSLNPPSCVKFSIVRSIYF